MRITKALLPLVAGGSILAMSLAASAQQTAIPGYDEAVARAASSDWATEESIRGGLHLVAQFDSSGPDAWSPEEHPLIYLTSESHQTYNPNLELEGSWAGFHLIDAYTKEVFADFVAVHDDDSSGVTRGPHGSFVSPDGKWAYVGWNERDETATRASGYVAVVNLHTLKIDKLLRQESHFRGKRRSQAPHHIMGCQTEDGRQRVIVQFGFGSAGGPHFILDPGNDNRVLRSITYEDVQVMGHPFVSPSRDCETAYVSISSPEQREAYAPSAGVAKVSIDSGNVVNVMGLGYHPVGITHSNDDKFSYIIDAHASMVYKLDNETNKVVGSTSAGVAGPYGMAMNWDESLLFTVGKGEGTHNVGQVVGVVDAERFAPFRGSIQMPIVLGGSASAIDHAILHPDPAVNEMWISNMSGWETIVLDLNTMLPKTYIPTPKGGDTHSGAFVAFQPDWSGELMADQGGPRGKTMREQVALAIDARLNPKAAADALPVTVENASPEQIARGKALFEGGAANFGCIECHGKTATGGVGPDIRGKGPAIIQGALRQFVPQMSFLSPDITDEEIVDIGSYLQTFEKH